MKEGISEMSRSARMAGPLAPRNGLLFRPVRTPPPTDSSRSRGRSIQRRPSVPHRTRGGRRPCGGYRHPIPCPPPRDRMRYAPTRTAGRIFPLGPDPSATPPSGIRSTACPMRAMPRETRFRPRRVFQPPLGRPGDARMPSVGSARPHGVMDEGRAVKTACTPSAGSQTDATQLLGILNRRVHTKPTDRRIGETPGRSPGRIP